MPWLVLPLVSETTSSVQNAWHHYLYTHTSTKLQTKNERITLPTAPPTPPHPIPIVRLVRPLLVIRRGRDRVRVSNVGPCRYQLLVLLQVAVRAGPRDLHLAGAERTFPLRLTEVGGGRRPLRRHRLIRAVE